ncbi:MAG: hypothetical protein AAFV86_10095 [Pseudomonadota bacterium]
MTQVLITGFEPFGGRVVNASAILSGALADRLATRLARGAPAGRGGVAHAILPVDHAAAAEALERLVARHRPRLVLMTGEWSGSAVRVETVGRPSVLVPWGAARGGGRAAARAARSLRSRLPVRLSPDAGRYVCDTTFWAGLGLAPGRAALTAAWFVHVPSDLEEAGHGRGRALVAALDGMLAAAGRARAA